jgi:hypothetical protein
LNDGKNLFADCVIHSAICDPFFQFGGIRFHSTIVIVPGIIALLAVAQGLGVVARLFVAVAEAQLCPE